MKNNEKDLVKLAVQGDKKAFCDLVSMHRAKLRSFSVNIACGNAALADDILQEALVKAFLSMKNFELRGSFTTWLWRIIKNEFINYLRDPSNRLETFSISIGEKDLDIPAAENSEKEMIMSDVREEVHRLISLLPLKLRTAVILVDIQEMCYEEAAEILEVSLTALKSRVFKGRKKLVEIVNGNVDTKQLSADRFRSTDDDEEE
ncbi:MAG TPA: RNA polymerase sigma factor [bacterium]|nr:RNA polymerase sigma factor [bacterium]